MLKPFKEIYKKKTIKNYPRKVNVGVDGALFTCKHGNLKKMQNFVLIYL